MAQAVWHAAHESTKAGGTASAAFHAFRPEVLAQLATPQPRPMREIVILGAQHEDNLGQRAAIYDQPQTIRLRVLLERTTPTRMAAPSGGWLPTNWTAMTSRPNASATCPKMHRVANATTWPHSGDRKVRKVRNE
jgi:hypothetical protein